MMMTYKILTIISTLSCLSLFIYAIKMRKVKSSLIFSMLMMFMTIFTFGSFLELVFKDIETIVFWRNFSLIGYLLSVPTLLVLVLNYIGKERLLKPINIALIYIFPIIGIVLRWTDTYHHLMRKDIFLVDGMLVITSTPFAEVIMFLERSIVIVAVILLIAFYNNGNQCYRKQLIGMVTGIMIPLTTEILKAIRPDMIGLLPPTSVMLTLTGIIIFWSIFRYQLLTVKPVVRDKIMDSIQEGILTVNALGKVIDINIAADSFFADIIGQNRDGIGISIDDLLSDWPRWFSACKDMKADEFEIEASALRGKKYYNIKVYPLNEKNTKGTGTVSILFDITENKIRDQELQYTAEWSKDQLKYLAEELNIQKKQLESIIENISDHCVVVDKTGNYILVNKAAKDLFSSIQIKKTGDYLKGARYYDINGSEIQADSVPAAKVMNGETLKNYRLILKNDEKEMHFDVNGTPVYDENGEFLFGVVCSHDITKIIRNKEKLKLQNEQFETIINTISDMAMLSIADKEGNYLYYSSGSKDYFPDNMFKSKAGSTYKKGMYFYEDGSEIELTNMPVFRVLRGEKMCNFHFITKSSKQEGHFLFNGTPVYDKDGNLSYGVFFNLDITEHVLHKRLVPVAEQLEELNKLKDKLFTVFSHDIRDPLATMINLTELLEEEKEYYNSDIIEIIETVKHHTNNTYEMAEHLLEWFKSQKEGLVHCPLSLNLTQTVNAVLKTSQIKAEIKGIKILNNIEPDITVFADKEMMELVLRNILSNAIKFTRKDGLISLDAQIAGEKVIISVSDNGVGIDPVKAKTLFCEANAGSTAGTDGEKGVGMGLLICKEFVQRNGGEIWMESIPGEGSTFYFSLPSEDKSKEIGFRD